MPAQPPSIATAGAADAAGGRRAAGDAGPIPSVGADELLRRLSPCVQPGAVLTDQEGLFVYECDGFTIARARPAAVVFPACTAEVAAVAKALADIGVPTV